MPESLFGLAILACPIGMGLMMWIMMRGTGRKPEAEPPVHEADVARLQGEINQLRAERDQSTTMADRPPA